MSNGNNRTDKSPIKFDKWEVIRDFNAIIACTLVFLFGFLCGAWFW